MRYFVILVTFVAQPDLILIKGKITKREWLISALSVLSVYLFQKIELVRDSQSSSEPCSRNIF